MRKLILLSVFLVCLAYCKEVKYEEKWSPGSLKINYGKILGDEPFPYHPTREENYKAREKGALTKFDVLVLTEDGKPLENATVGVGFSNPYGDYIRDVVYLERQTDARGMVHIEGKCGGRITIGAQKKGWYNSATITVLHEYSSKEISLQDGKWMPYGEITYTLVMRPVRKQIAMCGGFRSHQLRPGEPVGLDLLVGDWVEPNGKGETADVFLRYDSEETDDNLSETLTISFPNLGDGLYRRTKFMPSSYNTDYHASEASAQYTREIKYHKKHKAKMVRSPHSPTPVRELVLVSDDFAQIEKSNDYFVIRCRSELDEAGNVTSCHYAKTRYFHWQGNGHVHLEWLANPTPNDTNLEETLHALDTNLWENLMEKKRKRELLARSEANVLQLAQDFLAVLKQGDLEELKKYTKDWDDWRRVMVQDFYDETVSLFTSGEYEAEIEPKAFFCASYWAIVPFRIWKSGKKDDFEMRFIFLRRGDPERIDNWKVCVITPDMDKIKGKPEPTIEHLLSQYWDYKKAQMNDAKPPLGTEEEAVVAAKPEQVATAPQKEIAAQEATGKTMEALAKGVSGFLAALKSGDKETAVAAYGSVTTEQSPELEQWLSKALPFFSSGKVEAAVEAKAWVAGDVAIIPIRQWRSGKPEVFEIESTCLIRKNGKWVLLPDLESPFASVNALDETSARAFEMALMKFNEYKEERKKEMHTNLRK